MHRWTFLISCDGLNVFLLSEEEQGPCTLSWYLVFNGCYHDFVIAHHGFILTSACLSVTDEFMLPTPTTTHLLQPPPTALVPWWVPPVPPLSHFLLPSCPSPSWDLSVGWRLTSSHFPLIEFVSCANSSQNATLILPVNLINVLISWQCSACKLLYF